MGGHTRQFAVGLDLGAQESSLAVYDEKKQCSTPIEVQAAKTIPTCVAFEPGGGGNGGFITGKRAESRSAKKCEGVLCAYRQMIYGTEEAWEKHRGDCEARWHFTTKEGSGKGEVGIFMVGGEEISIEKLIEGMLEVICSTLLDAAKPGGVLQVEESETVAWVAFAVTVPECFSEFQRSVVVNACSEVVKRRLGVAVSDVNETLCVALQFASLPPLQPKTFMSIDLGASKLTVSAYELVQVEIGVFRIVEVASRTDVFCSGSEIEYRMMCWCEKRKPFQNSMLTSKPALFKLRKEIRNALKTLTVAEEATIEADGVVGGHDLQLVLTLEDFEHECADIFESIHSLASTVMGIVGKCVPECVLVGGAMRIPRVQRMLSSLLEGQGGVIKKTVDMDRAVSMGAATVAAVRCEGCSIKLPLDEANPFEELPKRHRPGDQEADAAAVNGGDAAKNGGGAKLAVLEEGEREVLMKRIAALQEGELVLKEQLHASQQLIGKLKEGAERGVELSSWRAKCDFATKQRDDAVSERDALLAERDALRAEVDGLLGEREGLRRRNEELVGEVLGWKGRVEEAEGRVSAAEKSTRDVEKKVGSAEAKLAEARDEKIRAERRAELAEADLKNWQDRARAAQGFASSFQEVVERSREDRKKVDDELKGEKAKRGEAEERAKVLAEELEEMRGSWEAAEERCSELKGEIEGMRGAGSAQKRTINEMEERGREREKALAADVAALQAEVEKTKASETKKAKQPHFWYF